MRVALPYVHRWPNAQIFVLRNRRILYQPVAKCACSSLKRLMVELSDLPEADKAAIRKNVHRGTDQGETGLILKDHAEAGARALLAEPGWFRFAAVREPLDRLASAYVEKFVVNRMRPYQHFATGPVVAAVQGAPDPSEADFHRGITFRQFVEHVVSRRPAELDPHWRPQIDYFRDVPVDRLYGTGDFDLLGRDLAAHCGEPVEIGHANRSRGERLAVLEGAMDMSPEALEDRAKGLATESFYDADLRARAATYFAADATLFQAATASCAARRAALAAEGVPLRTARVDPLARIGLDAAMRAGLRKAISLNGMRRALGLPPVMRG